MRTLLMPVVFIAALGSTSFAATSPPAAARDNPASATPRPSPLVKRQACADSWRKQAMHIGTRVVFMNACVNRG